MIAEQGDGIAVFGREMGNGFTYSTVGICVKLGTPLNVHNSLSSFSCQDPFTNRRRIIYIDQ